MKLLPFLTDDQRRNHSRVELFKKRGKGVFNGRVGTILAIDRQHDIASAKVKILIAARDMRFIDLFLLKKLEGKWKIISKAATRMPNK